MNKIAIFYHAQLNGGFRAIDESYAISVMQEQMDALMNSGLLDASDEFIVGSNGNDRDTIPARLLAGKKANFIQHAPNSCCEFETMRALKNWLPSHSDWKVMYFHTKGVSRPKEDAIWTHWRNCMMACIVWNWHSCVYDLDNGFDTVGAHWITRERYGPIVGTPYWGGTFWWANARFLLELPDFPKHPTDADRYYCESWIGMGRTPKVKDYAPHWPNVTDCQNNANSIKA